ncbi:caspase family protein [Limnoraphis robusta Tam1]|uniref:caspase family protein n=1 Tax=Limnoraphis robusta TaxID=1118279 RepID=UPI002B21C0C3|nr:caspase family protein [Limnoraphis robusta]MEA5543135.1 caspase family protein [Limnoraphis robusta Tam1]
MATNLAIVVGINQYSYLQPLRYGKQDAEAVASALEKAGFQVCLFTEDIPKVKYTQSTPGLPTYGNLYNFLYNQLGTLKLTQVDQLWFFFSGHGARKDGDYLMLSDSSPGGEGRTALSVNDVRERLRRCKADNIVMFFDACRNEGRRDGQGFGTEKLQGIITYYSCAAQEVSWEIEQLQHGAFTYVLLEILRNPGNKGCITVERLEQYLSQKVPQINKQYGKPIQTPHACVEPVSRGKIILFGEPKEEDIKALKYEARDAEGKNKVEARLLWREVNRRTKGLDPDYEEALLRMGSDFSDSSGSILAEQTKTCENSEIKASTSTPSPPARPPVKSPRKNPQQQKKKKNFQPISKIFFGTLLIALVTPLFFVKDRIQLPFQWPFNCQDTYENQDYGFKINYPCDWSEKEPVYSFFKNIKNIITFEPKNNAQNITMTITKRKLEENEQLSLLSYRDKHIENREEIAKQQGRKLELEDRVPTKLGNSDAYRLIFKTKKPGEKEVWETQVLTIRNNQAYIITYESPSDLDNHFKDTVDKMIQSFEFLD